MKHKIFVDGQVGTTGLKIFERLSVRDDIEILRIPDDKRKDIGERRKFLNQADIVFLCLPDDAAREAVSLIANDHTRVIDASTAHRVLDSWTYGIPEFGDSQYEALRQSKRVCVPGCYATGFNMLMYPLVSGGIVPTDYPVTCHAISGYSGGGNGMIHDFETNPQNGRTPALYALGLNHKHMPEMQKYSKLEHAPMFMPILGNYCQGMTVAVPLLLRRLKRRMTAASIAEFLAKFYDERQFVKVQAQAQSMDALENGRLYADGCVGTNSIELNVFGNDETVLVVSRLDNLGKGASGAAVQNMNIMLGMEESCGLQK